MKYKNYRSAIHNFTHSFICITYLKSGRLAVNVLIDLYNLGLETRATFDFINKTIKPDQALSDGSKQLMQDYLNWLPSHFNNHNCDLGKLEKLEITIWTDFDNTSQSKRRKKDRFYTQQALVKWKADGRDEEVIEGIKSEEVIPKKLLDSDKMPRRTEMN